MEERTGGTAGGASGEDLHAGAESASFGGTEIFFNAHLRRRGRPQACRWALGPKSATGPQHVFFGAGQQAAWELRGIGAASPNCSRPLTLRVGWGRWGGARASPTLMSCQPPPKAAAYKEGEESDSEEKWQLGGPSTEGSHGCSEPGMSSANCCT
jgi:hypothetical protein